MDSDMSRIQVLLEEHIDGFIKLEYITILFKSLVSRSTIIVPICTPNLRAKYFWGTCAIPAFVENRLGCFRHRDRVWHNNIGHERQHPCP